MECRRFALLFALAAGCAPGESGLLLELSGGEPVDALSVTVLGARGALVLDEPVPNARLPGRVRVASGARSEAVRVLVWGFRGLERVAFGRGAAAVAPGVERTVAIALAAAPSDRDGDRIPDVDDGCPELADPRQEDADGDGKTDACAAADGGSDAGYCPGNLISNGTFEDGTSGWVANDGTATRVPFGHSGGFAAQVCRVAQGIPYFTVNTEPLPVAGPPNGSGWRMEAWISTGSPDAGSQQLQGIIRELKQVGVTVAEGQSAMVTPDGLWQRVAASYTVKGPDSGYLEVYFVSLSPPAG
jgi:hypothetical protein